MSDYAEIARLQSVYSTEMNWAERETPGTAEQARHYLKAADAQRRLALITTGEMQKRNAAEMSRLTGLAKAILEPAPVPEKPAPGAPAPASASARAVPASAPAASPEKDARQAGEKGAKYDIPILNECRFSDPEKLKMSFSELSGREKERDMVINFFNQRELQKKYAKLRALEVANGAAESKLNMLIYGPPGTGKSSFLSAVGKYVLEREPNAVFFMLTPDLFRSKWRGDSEHLIKEVFLEAADFKTALICIDEITGLAPKNKDNISDADRSTLNTFLNEADGVINTKDSDIILIGGTNYPWDVDPAALSRFSERMYFGLPDLEARKSYLKQNAGIYLAGTDEEREELADRLAKRMDHAGYRELNALVSKLRGLGWKKTTEANPDNADVESFIPAAAEELDEFVSDIKIPYDEEYIRRLENTDLW